MAQADVAAKLGSVPIFSGCSKRELSVIARAAKEVSHKEGAVIAREGRGIGLFLILEGQCDVSVGGKSKAKLGPGDIFGEVALLDGGPRTATVTLGPIAGLDGNAGIAGVGRVRRVSRCCRIGASYAECEGSVL